MSDNEAKVYDNLEIFEAPLLYWVRQVSGLDGFFTGKKYQAPTDKDYFLFEFLSLNRRSRSFRKYNEETEKFDLYYNAEIIYRLTIYGDSSKSKIILAENSLQGYEVPMYLASHGLGYATSSNIKHFSPFDNTEFLPQSQIDLTFNVTLSSWEDMGIIEEANFTMQEQ